MKKDIEVLKKSIKHDKENDIKKHKDEIVQLLEEEIVGRYHFTKGKILYSFRNDNDITEALNLFKDKTRFTALLSPQSENSDK